MRSVICATYNRAILAGMMRIFAVEHYLSPRYSKACCSAIAYAKGLTRYSIAHTKKQSPLWSRAETLGVGAATALLFFCQESLYFTHTSSLQVGLPPTRHH